MTWTSYLWLVPLLPFLGAALNGLVGPQRPRALHTAIGVGAPGVSLLLSLLILWDFGHGARTA